MSDFDLVGVEQPPPAERRRRRSGPGKVPNWDDVQAWILDRLAGERRRCETFGRDLNVINFSQGQIKALEDLMDLPAILEEKEREGNA